MAVLVEFCVPVWAERPQPTPWHPHHLIERQGLLLLIVLGELLLSSTHALSDVLKTGDQFFGPVTAALGGMLIGFSIWWVYFAEAAHLRVLHQQPLVVWMNGHFVLFTACTAIGTGLSTAVEHHLGGHHAPMGINGIEVVGVATALCFVTLWVLRDRFVLSARQSARLLATAAAIAAAGLFNAPVLMIGGLATLYLVLRLAASGDLALRRDGAAQPE